MLIVSKVEHVELRHRNLLCFFGLHTWSLDFSRERGFFYRCVKCDATKRGGN